MIRELEGPGAAGVNRTNWDLRYDSPAEPTPEQLEAMAAGYDFGPRGPFVEPGEYSIKIKAGDQEAAQKVTVEEDPRLQLSAEDRAARRRLVSGPRRVHLGTATGVRPSSGRSKPRRLHRLRLFRSLLTCEGCCAPGRGTLHGSREHK